MPQPVAGDTKWQMVSASWYNSTLAIREDGTLWAWGDNSFGQLGIGSYNNASAPVQVGTSANWVFVSAGGAFTMALQQDGSLWSWGNNNYGQLGNGSLTTSRAFPARVDNSTNWIAVSAGGNHIVALRNDGTLWAWGANSYGQLGLGLNILSTNRPAIVESNMSWRAISAGGVHTIALRDDGTLWAWGANSRGQLGIGTLVDTNRPAMIMTIWPFGSAPVPIGTNYEWRAIAAGLEHSLAVTDDGTFWAWGNGADGRLGISGAGPYLWFPTAHAEGPVWSPPP